MLLPSAHGRTEASDLTRECQHLARLSPCFVLSSHVILTDTVSNTGSHSLTLGTPTHRHVLAEKADCQKSIATTSCHVAAKAHQNFFDC